MTMKRKNKIEAELLLMPEELLRQMIENPRQADQLIEDMCRENPEKEESIRLVAQLLRHYQAEQPHLSGEKIVGMWSNILRESEVRESARTFRLPVRWLIAASVAILCVLTFSLHKYSQNGSIRQFAKQQIKVGDEAKIIISDGSEYKLKSNNSHIRYDPDGKEIVIKEKNDQTDKLVNQQTEAKSIYNQIVVPYGTRYSVTLSDGTLVQLNSGSKLVFPAKFSGTRREVYLKGEGYFDVTKDEKKPFVVNTDYINVRVFGTQFNVSAYENEKYASAVLVEGSVDVSKSDGFFISEHYKIKPGEGCFFDEKASGLTIKTVDVPEYTSWKDGLFQFHDQSLSRIVEKVRMFYNKNITIEDDELANRIISGKLIISSTIDETIDLLARTTKSNYTLTKDGTYIFSK